MNDMRREGIQSEVSLAERTTLGVGGKAQYFTEVSTEEALERAVRWAEENGHPITILGDGTNVLVDDAGIPGLVIRPRFMDILYKEEGDTVRVDVGAGVVLDTCVEECISRGLWGFENLSGIPGTVGATPVQNVGAYGVEVSDLIVSVRVYDMETHTFREMQHAECLFAYRDSIFKSPRGKKLIITHVSFALQRNSSPKITYKDLALHFEGNASPSLHDIRDAVLAIRSKKFPDWRTVGTAGSFFKNPIVRPEVGEALLAKYPDLPTYVLKSGDMKVSLGWILDRVCDLKGYTEGNVRLFENQALVLVCAKGIPAREVKIFSEHIADRVFEETGIRIEREVTTLP